MNQDVNESINYTCILELMSKYNPQQKKTVKNDDDFLDELELFLEQLDQPKKKQFLEESIIVFDEQEIKNEQQKQNKKMLMTQESWLEKLPRKHVYDEIDELERMLNL